MKVVKNGRSKAYAMDGAALKKIFEKRGIDPRQFSEELGYHKTYFPKCIRENCIGEKAIGMLMSKGIKPTQYNVDMETTVKSKDPVTGLESDHVDNSLKRNSGRYPWGEEKSPAEQAIEEPGVVKVEFTLDIVKLKAIIKQAVKEAYEEL